MKKLVFVCLFVFSLIACADRNPLVGRWAMIMEESENDSSVLRDTLISSELRFDKDSVYIEVWSDGVKVRTDMLGVYTIDGDQITVTDRYGKQQVNKFVVKKDTLVIADKDDPNKILTQLIRIKRDQDAIPKGALPSE